MNLNDYITLGRTGLRVSPLCLGTMTFGTEWGFGAEENISRDMFNRYIDAGGNFVDTADGYTKGHSEELVGKFINDRNLRDFVVLATKFTFNFGTGNPNAGGNGRKNIYRALEASLRRLKQDYIDLYYVHAWDVVTPVEEVVETLNTLVREGKIRYYGFSDTPAWYVARAQTLAEQQGKVGIATLQLEYSLIERNIIFPPRRSLASVSARGARSGAVSLPVSTNGKGRVRRATAALQRRARFHFLTVFRSAIGKFWMRLRTRRKSSANRPRRSH